MTPREDRADIKDYRPILSIEARDALKGMAAGLRFFVTRQGTYKGKPSAPDMLEALTAVYRFDPAGTTAVLVALLAAHGLLPEPPDA